MFSIIIHFQQTSPQGVDENSANPGNSGLTSNTTCHTEDHMKEGGDDNTVDDNSDLCQILKSQLFDNHLHRLWRTGALLKVYNADEDCDTFEVS